MRRVAVYLMRFPAPGTEAVTWPTPGRDSKWTRLNSFMPAAVPPEGTWVVDGGLEWTYRIGFREAVETAHQLAATSWATTEAERT